MTQSTHQSLSYCRIHRVDSIPIDWCCSLRWVLDLLPGSSSGMILITCISWRPSFSKAIRPEARTLFAPLRMHVRKRRRTTFKQLSWKYITPLIHPKSVGLMVYHHFAHENGYFEYIIIYPNLGANPSLGSLGLITSSQTVVLSERLLIQDSPRVRSGVLKRLTWLADLPSRPSSFRRNIARV